MKTVKRTLSVILSIVIMLSCSYITAFADDENVVESGSCGNGLTYVLDTDGTLTVSGKGRMSNYSSIGSNNYAPWYNNRGLIKKVVLEDGVINIGASAFYNCKSLVDVDFGNIDTIGMYAFQYCVKLDSAMLPQDCKYLWNSAFESCTSLRKAYVPGIVIAASYNKIPYGVFKDCSSLAVLGLGTGIYDINQYAITGCTSLRTIISDTPGIKSSFGDTYNVIGWSERTGVCSDNTYTNDKLTWHYDFDNERLSFSGSGDMKYYAEGERPWDMFYNVIKKIDFSDTDGPCSTTSDSFKGYDSVEEVDFTNIREIGWRSFGDCTGIKHIHFDSTLTSIWDWAFERNTSLETITFEDGTQPLHIRQYAFFDCTNTTFWINFPSHLSQVDEGAFKGTKFNYITFKGTNHIDFGDNAFGTTDRDFAIRFVVPSGVDNKGVLPYVTEMREKYRYNWTVECDNGNHYYEATVVEPTCTKDGYVRYGCKYCMSKEVFTDNYNPKKGHHYVVNSIDGATVSYRCTTCGDEDYQLSAIELDGKFKPEVNTDTNTDSFKTTVDLNSDGYINAKDFAIIKKSIANIDTTNRETSIDINRTYQEIEGFGASAAWWAQEVGEWENASEILEMLYSEENGIGLDIYRYNLGAGSEDQKDYGIYNRGARTYCFMKEDGTYNWDNDQYAMHCLDLAVQFNPNLKITLFSNSAPYFMTKNGKTYATQEMSNKTNLDQSNYQAFADFTVKCAEHFIDEGYNVTEVSPINEPEWDWTAWYNGDGSQSHGQEGCHFSWSEALDFYNNYMVPALEDSEKLNGKVDLSVWECAQLNHQWLFNDLVNNLFSSKDYDYIDNDNKKQGVGFASNNSNIRNYTEYLATHSYWCSEDDRKNVAEKLSGEFFGQKVKCTEYCQMTNDTSTGVLGHIQNEGSTNGMTIDYGIALADIMYQDLTTLNAVEWDWWTACAKGVYTDNLLLINANDHSDVQTSKRYWCMGNFSKYVDVGAKRIQVDVESDFASNLKTYRTYHWTFHDDNWNISNSGVDKYNYIEQLAFLNPDGSVAIIFINCSDTIEYTRVNGGDYSTFSTYVTSETMDLKNFQNGKITDAVCIPARSVTTVVLR